MLALAKIVWKWVAVFMPAMETETAKLIAMMIFVNDNWNALVR